MDGVNLGNTETVCHCRAGSRATARTYRDTQLGAGCVDKVLYNEEVAWETHGLHDVEFKFEPLLHLLAQGVAITLLGPIKGQFSQVVGFQFDTIQLIVAPQTLDFCIGSLLTEHHLAVLVLGKLIKEVLLRQPLAVLRLGTKLFGYGEGRHDRGMVNGVHLHLVEYLQGVAKRFGNVGKDGVHLCLGLHPLLLGIDHAGRVIEVLACTEADEAVVRLSILLIHEVNVIGADYLDIVLLGQFQHLDIGLLLQGEGFPVGMDIGVGHLMTLQFEVIVVAKEILIPLDGLLGLVQLVIDQGTGHLTGNASRADNQPLVILFEFTPVGTGTHIVPFGPGTRHQFDEVVVPLLILSQHHQVISALVRFTLTMSHRATGHVHLTTDDGLEDACLGLSHLRAALGNGGLRVISGFLPALQGSNPFLQVFDFPLGATVLLVDVVGELLDAKHISMVGHGNATHAILHGLIDQSGHAGLAIKQGVLSMYM